jgi:hypothetical protein
LACLIVKHFLSWSGKLENNSNYNENECLINKKNGLILKGNIIWPQCNKIRNCHQNGKQDKNEKEKTKMSSSGILIIFKYLKKSQASQSLESNKN